MPMMLRMIAVACLKFRARGAAVLEALLSKLGVELAKRGITGDSAAKVLAAIREGLFGGNFRNMIDTLMTVKGAVGAVWSVFCAYLTWETFLGIYEFVSKSSTEEEFIKNFSTVAPVVEDEVLPIQLQVGKDGSVHAYVNGKQVNPALLWSQAQEAAEALNSESSTTQPRLDSVASNSGEPRDPNARIPICSVAYTMDGQHPEFVQVAAEIDRIRENVRIYANYLGLPVSQAAEFFRLHNSLREEDFFL